LEKDGTNNMPSYPIVPWLKPADATGAYTKGYSLGQQGAQVASQIALAQQRLAHDAQRAQVEVALRQQAIQEKSIIEQQRLEVARAYHDQMVSLQQQKLADAEAKVHEKMKQDALRAQAMQTYARAIASGADPVQASSALFPSMGTGAQTAFIKAHMTPAFIPGDLQSRSVLDENGNPIPGMISVPNASGTGMSARNVPSSPERISMVDRTRVALAKKAYTDAQNQLSKATKEDDNYRQLQDEVQTTGEILGDTLKSLGIKPETQPKTDYMKVPGFDQLIEPDSQASNGSVSDQYEVLTKDTKLKKGTLYQTPKGLLYYDGIGLLPPRSEGMKDTFASDESETDSELADLQDETDLEEA